MEARGRTLRWLFVVLGATILARVVYWTAFGVRFDASPLAWYIQYIDPPLLQTRLVESLLYLRDQPPGFNLFLGVVLKLFPQHDAPVFAAVYLACGLLLAAALFLLLVRTGLSHPASAVLALAFSVHPATVLYENWLFYSYPVACLLCWGALFLHRWIERFRLADGIVFGLLLAAVVLTRGTFHPAWLLAIVVALWVVFPEARRQLLYVGLIPLLLVALVYAKNYVLFDKAVSGKFILSSTLTSLTVDQLPESERERLVRSGELSRVSQVRPRMVRLEDYESILGPFEDTGIALLDLRFKASGMPNYHHAGWDAVGALQYHDAMYVLRHYPRLYLRAVGPNVGRYFDAAASYFSPPFSPPEYANSGRLAALLNPLARLQTRAFHAVAFGACVLFSGWVGGRWLLQRLFGHRAARQPIEDAFAATLLFCLFNVVYLGLVTVLLSDGEQNRYRFKVTPLYLVMFGALVATVRSFVAARGARRRAA
jgi:hypothetical protein